MTCSYMVFGPLKIRLYGDPCLRIKSKPVKEVGPVERMLIAAMFETVIACKGVGLAAPQVGINEQIFVVNTGKEVFAAINPKILKGIGSEVMQEGCLSVPSQEVLEEGCLSVPHVLVDINVLRLYGWNLPTQENRHVQAQLNGLVAQGIPA